MLKSRRVHLCGVLLALSACSSRGEDQEAGDVSGPIEPAPRQLRAVGTHWPMRSSTEVAERADRVLDAMRVERGESVGAVERSLSSAVANGSVWSDRPLKDAPGIHFQYYPGQDDLRVRNTDLADSYSGPELAQDRARGEFERVLVDLKNDGLIRDDGYDASAALVSTTEFGSGTVDGAEAASEIVEYHFTLRRTVDGIPFLNSGVQVSIHKSGRVSGIRVGGAKLQADEDWGEWGARVELEEYTFPPGPSEADLQRKVDDHLKNAFVHWQGVFYANDTNRDDGTSFCTPQSLSLSEQSILNGVREHHVRSMVIL